MTQDALRRRRGRLVTLEGLEGVGKTTCRTFIGAYLSARGVELVQTREPGGTPLGEVVRDQLLTVADAPMDPVSELLFFYAARRENITQVILPNLARGAWVLSDRFETSSHAYQGYGRGLPLSYLEDLDRMVLQGLEVDLTLVLDLPPAVGLARLQGERDRFEAEEEAFFLRAREGLLKIAADNPQRYAVIDAQQPLEKVTEAIARGLDRLIIRSDGAPR